MVLTSDASGAWGCGAYTSTGLWFQLKFPDSWSELHITVKELLPIVLAVVMWGCLWTGMTVLCMCDNMAVVTIINSGRSRMDKAMHLMRCFLAWWDVALVCKHIPGADNDTADALSRNYSSSWCQSQQRTPPAFQRVSCSVWSTMPRIGPKWTG